CRRSPCTPALRRRSITWRCPRGTPQRSIAANFRASSNRRSPRWSGTWSSRSPPSRSRPSSACANGRNGPQSGRARRGNSCSTNPCAAARRPCVTRRNSQRTCSPNAPSCAHWLLLYRKGNRLSDSIIIGENWISEHYFAAQGKQSFSGQVLERRKEWDDPNSVRSRFISARQELVRQYARLDDVLAQEQSGAIICAEIYDHLLEVLGYNRIGLHHTAEGPLTRIRSTYMTSGGPLVTLRAKPVDDVQELLAKNANTLFEPYEINETDSTASAGYTLTYVFNEADAPEFALVLSGGLLLVAQRTRWAEGRYLAVDLALVAQRNDAKRGGEIERALTCVSEESLAPSADGSVWWSQVLEQSVSHTVGVSQDLRDGVRESIEIIASEVVARRNAQDLPPLPKDQAQPLAVQSLRFLYRILFLLYAEASPELGVLPAGDPAYERGYSLDRLRELELVEMSDPREHHGTHLYDSLAVLFRMVDEGHQEGTTFNPLRADLFTKEATKYIDEVGLGNKALQGVLQRLLVSKKTSRADRGFISYAELGINQLGAVYEGLMSYTGFFAEEDLYEDAAKRDSSRGSGVVPTHRYDGLAG